jgi:poly(3-hydroxybutyrate) depolymerase
MVAAANTGNGVHRAIRYQLALDGLATVSERYLVDPRRVYAVGISGGGQISTHLWLCMPDLFTGAVPIVALASYENIPADMGKVWEATIAKPTPKQFNMAKAHRCAVMTGGKDFNEKIVHDAAKLLVRDGFKVQVYDYPDMGHEAPRAERFTEALKWVDEPYRALREKETKAAEDALARVAANTSWTGEARKAALVEVMKLGPWTPAAWKAAEMLGVSPP